MCGIAGLIHRGKSSNVGEELQSMLQALKHRGPDSTGYALYAQNDGQNFIMRFKVGENVGEGSTSVNEDVSVYNERKKLVDKNLSELGATIVKEEQLTPYSYRYEIKYDKDLMDFSKKIESVEMVEILSIGKSLELIKKIEENGGYFHDQKNQEIFQEILMNHKREKEQYESGDKVLVGQNKFINA